MSTGQAVYTIFFALFFAVTLSNTSRLNLFDTSAMYSFKYPKAWCRFIISTFFLNIFPLISFYFSMEKLANYGKYATSLKFWDYLYILMLSFIGFGLYRILFGILTLKTKDKKHRLFYDNGLYEELLIENSIEKQITVPTRVDPIEKQATAPTRVDPITDNLAHRPKIQDNNARSHIISGLVWVIITVFPLIVRVELVTYFICILVLALIMLAIVILKNL